jgi:hypothetical protein
VSHSTSRRIASCVLALGFVLSASGCGNSVVVKADPAGLVGSSDPGCIAALKAISTYGPQAVDFLAHGREDVNKAEVHLLVLALDAAADVAQRPADKQAISTLANVYEEYYDFTTNVVAVPAGTLLKDTSDLESVCK